MLRSILRHQACQHQLEKLVFTSIARTQGTLSIGSLRTLTGKPNMVNTSCLLSNPVEIASCQISRNFSTSPSNATDKDQKAPEKIGIIKKFKKMMKDYWYVLIPVHVATSIVW